MVVAGDLGDGTSLLALYVAFFSTMECFEHLTVLPRASSVQISQILIGAFDTSSGVKFKVNSGVFGQGYVLSPRWTDYCVKFQLERKTDESW